MSDSETEEIKKFNDWNPIKEDYDDLNFNRYCDEFEPETNDKKSSSNHSKNPYYKNLPYLFVKNIPREMTKTAVYNLFSNYGKVVEVRAPKANIMFVDFSTIQDMEKAFSKIKDNDFGLIVSIGFAKAKPIVKINRDLPVENHGAEKTENVDEINITDRTIVQCFSEPKPPVFEMETFVNAKEWNSSKLATVDPNKHFFITSDMHFRERMGLKTKQNEKFNIFTGRLYYLPDEKDNERMKIAQKENKVSEFVDYDKMGIKRCAKCNALTNKVCAENLKYYCSIACMNYQLTANK